MENTLVLEFIGRDDFSHKTYKTEDGKILKDVGSGLGDLELCTVCGDWWGDAEPNMPIEKVGKYKGLKIVITGEENEPSPSERFNYMMLGRLKSDCENHLNAFSPSVKIKADRIPDIIQEMKDLYNSFPDNKKPEWLTLDKIESYERTMLSE